ncbi:MAG: hypothetical protein EZS28_005643 [Streblomastix strix]|uniref:Uncharacterized protein n=1 Tax=Streblomastix strix TaxID=222440 RepID=A0A5J4WWW2_9EUKA|nr:MAG: hypothetical protein EZS28_005643 [Streblomastix strix]
MTSAYNKSQLIEVGLLFGEDLRYSTNKVRRWDLNALLDEYQIDKPHGYSTDLKNRVKAAVKKRKKAKQQRDQPLATRSIANESLRDSFEKQRLENEQKQAAQRRRHEEEARDNFENLRYDEDGIQEVTYDIRYPHNNILNALNPESLIDSQDELEKFIQYLPAKIIENQERTVEDTHTRFVVIVSMVVVVYRERPGGAAPAELQKYIQRQEMKFVDNLNYRNNCLFEALSFISLPDESTKRKSNYS